MKKFISLALTAAMVASLVPATAFAKTKDGDILNGTVSVVNSWNENKDFDGDVAGAKVPEAQIRVGNVDYRGTDRDATARFTLRLDNANFFTADDLSTEAKKTAARTAFNQGITVSLNTNSGKPSGPAVANAKMYTAATEAQIEALLKDFFDVGGSAGTLTGTYTGWKEITTAGVNDYNSGAPTTAGISAGIPASATIVNTVDKAWVDGVDSNAIDDPAGKSVTTNRNDAFDAWAKDATNGGNIAADAAKYSFVTSGVSLGFADEPGWLYLASGSGKPFVSLSTIEAYAVTKTLKDGAGGTTGNPITDADGKIISTQTDYATWLTAAKAAVAAELVANSSAIYIEKTDDYAGTPGTGYDRVGFVKAEIAQNSDMRKNEIIVTVTGPIERDDIISVDLVSELVNNSKNAGFSITSSDFTLTNDNADFTYVNVDKEALVLSIRKVVDVAEDEKVKLDDKGLSIKTNVGTFRTGTDNEVTLKISKGFEFVPSSIGKVEIVAKMDGANATGVSISESGKEEIVLKIADGSNVNEIILYGIEVKATSAKIEKVCTIRATSPGFNASAAVEVAKVVDYIVELNVDEDEDVPVIYSGVDVNNYGLTDDSDHWSLEVTAEESFPGAWSFRKGFNFELPEHVFVTDVDVISTENFLLSDDTAKDDATPVDNDEVFVAFFNAYQNGSHVNFEFDKRVFDDVDATLTDEPASMTFRLQLVADTGFEGDAVLKLTGELVDEQEVTIAKFVKPYEVKAEQNDIIIDYRYTDIPTAITITEAEGGLWDKDNATFRFKLENHEHNFFEFEGDPTFEVDSKSDMSLKSAKVNDEGMIQFTVDSESDEAATIEIKGMQLFMNRSIPAGPYDLLIESSLDDAYHEQMLFAPDAIESLAGPNYENSYRTQVKNVGAYTGTGAAKEDSYVGHVEDCTTTVKEAFVNVVTAGRDQDDASFTTKVVVPVGEDHIFAGEKEIKLDTPAYINEAGYTMLPIRAVAVALGINSNNVLWDQPTKTVTILYGQRIITMTQGQKVVYVNGSAIPASAAVENTNSRTFLPMRDLATALGVTDITWDQASRTATLNGNQK